MNLYIVYAFCSPLIIIALDPKTVLDLGNEIEREINEMDGDKVTIKKNLATYGRYMKQILELLKKDDPQGHKLFAALEDVVGPPHITLPIYHFLNEGIYNWTTSESRRLLKVIDGTIDTWEEIENIVANKTGRLPDVIERNTSHVVLPTLTNLTLVEVNTTKQNFTIYVVNDTLGHFAVDY